MPPADNATPTPVPTPEEPKKPGFFARLFGGGKKVAAPAVPENHESQTPPPQLDDTSDSSPATSIVAPANTDPLTGAQSTEVASSNTSADTTTPSLAVPPSIASQTQGETPSLPVEGPAAPVPGFGAQESEKKDDSQTPPSPTSLPQ